MHKVKVYDVKIAAYFDNEMSEGEETAFMQEVGDDAALREKFEDELAMRAFMGSITRKGEDGLKKEQQAPPVIIFYRRFKNIAAVLITIIAVSIIFLLVRHNQAAPVALIPVVKHSAAEQGTPGDKSQQIPPGINLAVIYKQSYQPYTSETDPAEVSYYYQQYKNARYGDVLKATGADVQQMGTGDNTDRLNQYLQLYKGLAYLAQNNAAKAMVLFDTVLHTAPKTAPQYYTAQWYSALAALKLGLANKADSTAGIITKSASPYKGQAGKLHEYLSGKQVAP